MQRRADRHAGDGAGVPLAGVGVTDLHLVAIRHQLPHRLTDERTGLRNAAPLCPAGVLAVCADLADGHMLAGDLDHLVKIDVGLVITPGCGQDVPGDKGVLDEPISLVTRLRGRTRTEILKTASKQLLYRAVLRGWAFRPCIAMPAIRTPVASRPATPIGMAVAHLTGRGRAVM